ncbi:MAG: TonB-dependent receptor, partial [Planctomycetales bacterium]
PYFATVTYTEAQQLSDSSSTDAESIFAGGFAGARIPYVPQWLVQFGTGLHFTDRFGVDVTGTYQSEMFTTASNVRNQINPVTGLPDSRFGVTDSFFVWDLSAYAYVSSNWKLFGGVQNLFDRRYITTRHPHGPRPALPLFGYLGAEAVY